MSVKKKSAKLRIPLSGFLINETRNVVLANEGKVLRGLSTALGAMFKGLPGSLVLVWWRSSRISITNVFVPQDLDLLWLNDQFCVVWMVEGFPAGAWRTSNDLPARYVVELPSGTIATSKTRVGDKIVCRDLSTQ